MSEGRGPGIWKVGLATGALETAGGGDAIAERVAGADTGADDVGAAGADVAVVGVMLSGAAARWAGACTSDWWDTAMTVTTAITATHPAAAQAIAARRRADDGTPREFTLHLDG